MARFVEPKAYLISKPCVDWSAVADFLNDEGLPGLSKSVRSGLDDAAALPEIAARLCYMSFGRGRRDIGDFIRNLLESRHGSVFEHVIYGILFTGVSRSLTHELVRHRAGFAYSQLSQRYVDGADCAFILPPAVGAAGDGARLAANAALDGAMRGYEDLVAALERELPETAGETRTTRRKAIREAARAALPNAAETKIMVTGNVRAWRHFIETRASEHADAEIRRLALIALRLLGDDAPLLFGDFRIEKRADGSEITAPLYSKV